MDSELRRRFLQILGQDIAAMELNEMGVKPWAGKRYELDGARRWREVRAWWRG